jgi:hypothetical protein
MATSVWQLGDNDTARRAYEQSLQMFRRLGDDNMGAHPIGGLGCLAFDRGEYRRGRELIEESVARFRAFNDRHYLALELDRAGDMAVAVCDADAADRAYHESLTLSLESGFRFTSTLEGFAMLAASHAQPERALQLAGAAAAMRDANGSPRKPAERVRLERALTAARAALGPAAEEAWQRGRRMSTQEAVDAALATPVGLGAQAMFPTATHAGSATRISDPHSPPV